MFDTEKFPLRKGKSGYWEIRWSEDRGDRHVSRSHSTRETERAAAETYRRHWLKAREELTQQSRGPLTIGDLCDHYEVNANQRKVSATQYHVLKLLRRHVGNLRPVDLDEGEVLGYRKARGVSDATLRRELGVLVAVLNFGARKKLIPAADVPHVDLPPEGQPREVFLSPAEEREFVALLMKDPMSRHSRFCLLALRTGARKGAIEGLTWDRVDFEGRYVDYRVPGARKSKKRRVPVPVDDVLLPVLEQAHFFATDKFVIGAGSIRRQWDVFRRKNPKFAHVTPHVLRHTAATRWLRDGLSLWDVAGLLGDTVETVAKVYGHHATSDLRAAMTRSAA
jgi:integrase